MVAGGLAEGEGGRDTQASNTLMASGFFGALLATPIIHGVRRHPDRALASFALRTALSSVGGYIAVSTANCHDDSEMFCGLDRLGPGFLAGFVVASLIDAKTMTTERRPAPTWTPMVGADPHGVRLGLSGSF